MSNYSERKVQLARPEHLRSPKWRTETIKDVNKIVDEFSHIPCQHKRYRLRALRDGKCPRCGKLRDIEGQYCQKCKTDHDLKRFETRKAKTLARGHRWNPPILYSPISQ